MKSKLCKLINQSIQSRKSYESEGCEVFKQVYCCCCIKNNKEKIINYAMEYIDSCSELGNLVTLKREFDLFKKLLLRKEQRNMIVNKSSNLKVEFDVDNDDKNEETYIEKLNKVTENIEKIDLKERKNRIITKNIIESLI